MTNTQSLIARLKHLNATMTRGRWEYGNEAVFASENWQSGNSCDEICDFVSIENGCGIATLKNANPTVIAMLERAIAGVGHVSMIIDPARREAYRNAILADLDALAREAMEVKS